MIDEKVLIADLKKMKEYVSNDLHGELMVITIDLIIKKIETQPQICESPHPAWKETMMQHFLKGD